MSNAGAPISPEEAFRNARAAVDAARRARDSLPIKEAARAAAAGSNRTPAEIEMQIRRLRKQAQTSPASAGPRAAAA